MENAFDRRPVSDPLRPEPAAGAPTPPTLLEDEEEFDASLRNTVRGLGRLIERRRKPS